MIHQAPTNTHKIYIDNQQDPIIRDTLDTSLHEDLALN